MGLMCSQEGFKDALAHMPVCLAQAVPGPVEGVPSLIFFSHLQGGRSLGHSGVTQAQANM